MVMRALGWGDLSGQPDPKYPDVRSSHWAYDEIAAMKNAGFFAPEGEFKPNQKLTRAEMADILVHTFGLYSSSNTRFTDVGRNYWAYDSIQILAGNRITTGYDDGTFRPESPVTRTEFAVFMARTLDESFRPEQLEGMEGVQTIFDIEVGGQLYQLEKPLLLTSTWMVPAELFEKMGYQVESVSSDKVFVTTTEGIQFSMEAGQTEVWVGGTLVNVTKGVEQINGQPYIEGFNVLRVLDKPLVYYPEERLVRIEAPRVTVQDIKRKAPEAILNLIHKEAPYWQWTKSDSDYLELMRRNGTVHRKTLLEEMRALTEAFFSIEQEKTVIRGLNYYSDHVTGKIDAVTRALEARYRLLYEPQQYAYPAIGKSGAAGAWTYAPDTQFAYTVSDFSFEFLAENKQALIELIESSKDLNFEALRGLNVYGIPFSIREVHEDGTAEAFSGKAMGSDEMLVTNSNAGTFMHEFGHNWDAMFGDEQQYLALRGKAGYTPASNDWENRIEENFAEDFAAAFLPDSYPRVFKGGFDAPSEEMTENFRAWMKQREQQFGPVPVNEYTLNGSAVAPKVILVKDRKLRIQGEAERNVTGDIVNEADSSATPIEIAANGGTFDQTVTLPAEGVYRLYLGKFNTIVVYHP